MSHHRWFVKAIAAIVLAGALGGCVVEPGPGPSRWCYYHPYRC